MEIVSNKQNKVPFATEISGKLNPIADWVYVQPELQDQYKTSSGLIIRGPKHQGVPKTGKIINLGPDVAKEIGLEPHMRVVVNDPNMRGFHLNGQPIVPLKPENVIAIIQEDA